MPSGVKDIQLLELKDTISQLNKTISTQNELISSLQKMLEERNAKDSEKDLLIANLQSQLAYLKNKVFGSTSEIRHDQLDGQLNLFGTPVGDEKPAEVIEPEVISVKGYTKERKPKATYDDKYNSVRSICKHFFTDIVGLSIKFFCVSLRHMSICRGVVGTITFQQVDNTPHGKTSAQSHNQNLQHFDSRVKKFHTVFSFSLIKMDWWVQKKPPMMAASLRANVARGHTNSSLSRSSKFKRSASSSVSVSSTSYTVYSSSGFSLNGRRRNRLSRWKAFFFLSNSAVYL